MATTPLGDILTPEQPEALARSIPFPSPLDKPLEYADLVAHLISNRVNGEVLRGRRGPDETAMNTDFSDWRRTRSPIPERRERCMARQRGR